MRLALGLHATQASLARLGLPKTSLYMQHWPGFFINAFSNDAYLQVSVCRSRPLS